MPPFYQFYFVIEHLVFSYRTSEQEYLGRNGGKFFPKRISIFWVSWPSIVLTRPRMFSIVYNHFSVAFFKNCIAGASNIFDFVLVLLLTVMTKNGFDWISPFSKLIANIEGFSEKLLCRQNLSLNLLIEYVGYEKVSDNRVLIRNWYQVKVIFQSFFSCFAKNNCASSSVILIDTE